MFKSKDRVKKVVRRRARAESDDDEEEQQTDKNDNDLRQHLESTKKRRTLIHQLQFKRGVDSTELLTVASSAPSASSLRSGIVNNNTSKLSPLPTDDPILDPNEQMQSVWDKKHAAAMEEFVQSQLVQQQEKSARESGLGNEPTIDQTSSSRSENLSSSNNLLANGTSGSNSQDVLTAGAATALAEVILPVSERLSVVTETARATTSAKVARPHRPMPNAAVPNRFRTSSSHHHHHPKIPSGIQNDSPTEQTESTTATAVDSDRLGFAAARQQQQQSVRATGSHPTNNTQQNNNNYNNNNRTRSSDNRVYQQFVKRQREQQQRGR